MGTWPIFLQRGRSFVDINGGSRSSFSPHSLVTIQLLQKLLTNLLVSSSEEYLISAMVASTLHCSRCLAVALLALSLLIGWSEQAVVHHLDRVLSPPLVNEDTYMVVNEVAKQVSFFQW